MGNNEKVNYCEAPVGTQPTLRIVKSYEQPPVDKRAFDIRYFPNYDWSSVRRMDIPLDETEISRRTQEIQDCFERFQDIFIRFRGGPAGTPHEARVVGYTIEKHWSGITVVTQDLRLFVEPDPDMLTDDPPDFA